MSISDFHALHRDSGMEYAFVSTTYHNYIINSVIKLNNANSRDFLSGKYVGDVMTALDWHPFHVYMDI